MPSEILEEQYLEVVALAEAEPIPDRKEALFHRAAVLLVGAETIRTMELNITRVTRKFAQFARRRRVV